MRVQILEYGDDPEREFQEDFNSFKVFTVWSEPEVEAVDELPADFTVYESPEESPLEPKRLVTAVEFAVHEGGYFFVETPGPGPEWLNRVFDLLREQGWEGHAFQDFRVGCRGEISIEEEDDWVAVIDEEKEKVFHNRGKQQGDGKVEELENFRKA